MDNPANNRGTEILAFREERAGRFLAELRRVENRFPWIRLGVLLVVLLAAFLAFQLLPLGVAAVASMLAFGLFAAATAAHNRVIERMARVETFRKLLQEHAARKILDWEHIPASGNPAVPLEHPFNADLNVTGSRSLHQLIDTSVSLGGSQRLADWLLAQTPQPERILERQKAVQELIDRPGLRTRLELSGLLASPQSARRWDTAALAAWLERHTSGGSLKRHLIVLSVLALANIGLFAAHALGLLGPYWIVTLALYMLLSATKYRESSEVFEEAYTLAQQVGRLRVVMAELETAQAQRDGAIAKLLRVFQQARSSPSQALRRIGLIATAASLRQNPLLGLLLNLLVPWDLYFAYRLEQTKKDLRGLLPGWLDAWYEMEALASLAVFASLNPGNTFPVILADAAQPVFAAQAVGHPLIPAGARVDNHFTVPSLGQITIITGSNMSGKSTFLRTLGANLCLAFAGSTVCAASLRTVPFRLFTSMNVADSLSDGISFFYAEVRRLRALLDALESDRPYPLFFLIDEIFRGTNNRERQLGSRAYTQSLAGKRGVGLISTHDLELAQLAKIIPQVSNFHFREDVRGGEMVFDYLIRAGESPTTNALRIMALAGLPVPENEDIPRKTTT